jgi:hypothetical protein
LSTAKTLTKNIDFDIRGLLLGTDPNCFRRREGRWLETRSECRDGLKGKVILQIKRRRTV